MPIYTHHIQPLEQQLIKVQKRTTWHDRSKNTDVLTWYALFIWLAAQLAYFILSFFIFALAFGLEAIWLADQEYKNKTSVTIKQMCMKLTESIQHLCIQSPTQSNSEKKGQKKPQLLVNSIQMRISLNFFNNCLF